MTTSRSLNKVMIIGNLTRDPQVRKIGEKESLVCTFGVATNATWKDAEGNIQERTEFHNIVAWNKLGEICAQILSKGMLVYLEGELRTRTWESTDGSKRYKVEIKLNDMKLLDAKGKKGVGVEAAMEERVEGRPADKSEDKDTDTSKDKDADVKDPVAQDDGEDLF